MSCLFYGCSSLISLPDISKWSVNNVNNMSYLFYGCSSLIYLPDISKWKVNNVNNMSYLFSGCSSLTSLPDISKWKVNNVIDMSWLFSSCSSLKAVPDISKWNVNNITNMSDLFDGCSSLLKKYINKPKIIKENLPTNENICKLESIIENSSVFNVKEKLEKNLKESEKNSIMDCENILFASYNELRNNKSIRDFYDNFENCNSESINFGINTDNTYFSFSKNIPQENNKSNKDFVETLNAEIDKNEINNDEFLSDITKEEKDNCIYIHIFTENHKLLNKGLIKELTDINNLMNYINLKIKKKQKLINNLNDFKQFYHKPIEFETLLLNINIPIIKTYNLIDNNFCGNCGVGFLLKKYINEKNFYFYKKKTI